MPCERENKSISTADASIIKPIAKPQVGRRSKSYPVHAPDLRRITSFTLITLEQSHRWHAHVKLNTPFSSPTHHKQHRGDIPPWVGDSNVWKANTSFQASA